MTVVAITGGCGDSEKSTLFFKWTRSTKRVPPEKRNKVDNSPLMGLKQCLWIVKTPK